MNLNEIRKLAYELLGDKASHSWKEIGNKYYHGERVANLVLNLRKQIFPNDNSHDDILTVAAWFHDIMNGSKNHAEEGAEKAREVLRDYCTEQELNEICEIISVHDDRYSGRDTYNNYIKLQQDADHLDHFGTYDIWMAFLYAVPHDMKFHEVIDWLNNVRPTQDEKYRNELNFSLSKKIYDEKTEFLKHFAERFQVEGSGGIWNVDKIK
jgi:uncharacterized protein